MITNVMERLIDFTRTSGGGYFGPDGLFRFTPASRNLLLYTQEFDSSTWSKSAAVAYPFDPALATYGPELVTNGGFSAGSTGWSSVDWVVSAGVATVTNALDSITQITSLVAGRFYKVTYTVTAFSGTGAVRPRFFGGTAVTGTNVSAPGQYTEYLLALSGNTQVAIATTTNTCTVSIDNISVREVTTLGLTAPDGTLTADAVLPTATTAAHNISQSAGGSGVVITMSVYAKAGTSSFIQLYHGSASSLFANFNLGAGTVGTVGAGATASITSAGDGWYRCSMTCTPGIASTSRIAMITSATAAYNESWAATGTESIYLWGAQLEAASAATDYTRNNGGLYPPRFDYDPVTLAPRGLLIEEQRTNLLLRSEEFENAAWVKSNATVAANAVVSPDGTANADTLTSTGSGGRVVQNATASATGSHTASVYVKAGTSSSFHLLLRNGTTATNIASIVFDLASGTISSVMAGSGTITALSNGWYRVSVTSPSGITAGDLLITYLYAGASDNVAGSSVILWGAQLEAGAFATSYIPTAASQVTRTADVAVITGANFSQWYNQTSGTFLVEWRQGGSEAVQIAASVNDGTANNIMSVLNDNSSAAGVTPGAAVTNGGVAQANLTGAAITAGSTNKTALAYALNDFAYSQNGAAALTDTSGTIPTVDRLDIGNRVSALFTNGHIRRVRFYPTRLSNTQLQALTA